MITAVYWNLAGFESLLLLPRVEKPAPGRPQSVLLSDLWREVEWKSATCVLIESMEEMAAYIYSSQGAWNACNS
jgi:hypothetical protein